MPRLFGDLVLRPWFAFGLGVLPFLAFAASDCLLRQAGLNFQWMPSHFAEFDASRAEALRLTVFGAFLLFGACAAAAVFYFLFTLRLLKRKHALAMLVLFLLSNLIIGLTLVPATSSQADKFVGSELVCTALSYDVAQSDAGTKVVEKDQPTKVEVRNKMKERQENKIKGGPTCNPASRAGLDWLLKRNKIGVLLGLTSLIFGSILCLAGPADDARWSVSRAVAHYEEQSERLNTYLYLSALLLVTGLLFISAIFRWPTHALLPDTSYEAHVDALTAFYGFSYTIVIAAFYIPVAVLLSARVKALKPDKDGTASVPDAFKGPLQVLKIAAAIFSTSLAGIVSSLASLG